MIHRTIGLIIFGFGECLAIKCGRDIKMFPYSCALLNLIILQY